MPVKFVARDWEFVVILEHKLKHSDEVPFECAICKEKLQAEVTEEP